MEKRTGKIINLSTQDVLNYATEYNTLTLTEPSGATHQIEQVQHDDNEGEEYGCMCRGKEINFKVSPESSWKLSGSELKDTGTCVICGVNTYINLGNNPDPVSLYGRCCSDCDSTVVAPARFAEFVERNKE